MDQLSHIDSDANHTCLQRIFHEISTAAQNLVNPGKCQRNGAMIDILPGRFAASFTGRKKRLGNSLFKTRIWYNFQLVLALKSMSKFTSKAHHNNVIK